MIWVGGRIVPDDALTIDVRDRTFEHGLGLFETLRTWDGRAPLLPRHLDRLVRSAKELAIPLDPRALPDPGAVVALLRADRIAGDAILRITLSGGLTDSGGSALWMRSAELTSMAQDGGAALDLGTWRVTREDPLARHKTLNYWGRRLAYQRARSLGFDEVVSMTPCGSLGEGSRTNLFLVRGGTLSTPSLDGPIVPGIMRALVLERARGLSLELREADDLNGDDLRRADEVFLTNSVRGIIPVARALDLTWPGPGPWTRRLRDETSDWLATAGSR